MGSGRGGRAALPHPDPTAAPDDRRPWHPILLVVLAVDGVISALIGAFFLPLYLGAVPFPISAVVSGALNAALVWAGAQVTPSLRLAALPLWTWLATVAGLTFGGPGGDVVFGATNWGAIALVLLLVLGVAPAAAVLRRQRPMEPTSRPSSRPSRRPSSRQTQPPSPRR